MIQLKFLKSQWAVINTIITGIITQLKVHKFETGLTALGGWSTSIFMKAGFFDSIPLFVSIPEWFELVPGALGTLIPVIAGSIIYARKSAQKRRNEREAHLVKLEAEKEIHLTILLEKAIKLNLIDKDMSLEEKLKVIKKLKELDNDTATKV